MKKVSLSIDGKRVSGVVEKIKGELWVHLNGKTFTFKPQSKAYGAGASSEAGDPEKITAPMPGKVIQVKSSKGTEVQQGDVLVVMEAMKMEYALKAAIDGTVSEVNCKQGEQVDLGQVLVRLEGANV